MMINDLERNQFFHRALSTVAKDKVVLDIGTGTGILSVYALTAGAKFVYAVEKDPEAAKMAQAILSKCFDQSRFKVICCNFWTTDIDTQLEENSIDLLVSETVGPGLFDQGMIQTWHCAKPFLKKDAISIPDCLSSDVKIWQSKNTNDIFNNKWPPRFPRGIFSTVDEENLIDSNYTQALIAFNEEVSEVEVGDIVDIKNNDSRCKTEWKIVKNITVPHDHEYKDIYKFTKDSLPELAFYDCDPPYHIQADIKFELDLIDTSVVALIHKISFESDTLYLYNAPLSAWKFSPVFQIKDAGRTQFKFNPNFGFMTDDEWIISSIPGEKL